MPAKLPTISPQSYPRLLSLVGIIARQPGIPFDELKAVLDEDTQKPGGWGASTLLKDIANLKALGVLDDVRHRQGYFLTGPAFSEEEMRVLLNGLRLQAEDLGNPMARDLYDALLSRFSYKSGEPAALGYPIEASTNRPVTKTNTDDFRDLMGHLRGPILQGQQVRVRHVRDPWRPRAAAKEFLIYPLQFVFHDVAWYLLAEDARAQTFMLLRLDRLSPAIHLVERTKRGYDTQCERLSTARKVLRRGWGSGMPPHEPDGRLKGDEVDVVVRFAPEVANFLDENKHRHDTQTTKRQADGAIIFTVTLPNAEGVLFQFRRWVLSWGRSAEVLSPAAFRTTLAEELAGLLSQYQSRSAEVVSVIPAPVASDELPIG